MSRVKYETRVDCFISGVFFEKNTVLELFEKEAKYEVLAGKLLPHRAESVAPPLPPSASGSPEPVEEPHITKLNLPASRRQRFLEERGLTDAGNEQPDRPGD